MYHEEENGIKWGLYTNFPLNGAIIFQRREKLNNKKNTRMKLFSISIVRMRNCVWKYEIKEG